MEPNAEDFDTQYFVRVNFGSAKRFYRWLATLLPLPPTLLLLPRLSLHLLPPFHGYWSFCTIQKHFLFSICCSRISQKEIFLKKKLKPSENCMILQQHEIWSPSVWMTRSFQRKHFWIHGIAAAAEAAGQWDSLGKARKLSPGFATGIANRAQNK